MAELKQKVNWQMILSMRSLAYTALGVFCAIFALKGFMIPNHFLDGGVIGISILAHEIFHVNISWFLIVFNIPFIIMGYKKNWGDFYHTGHHCHWFASHFYECVKHTNGNQRQNINCHFWWVFNGFKCWFCY